MLALTSATTALSSAAAAALMVMSFLQLSAAAVDATPTLSPPAAPMIGLPNCATTCGDVSVPYPFGFGPSHCYWPGLNLTCDTTSHATPRLLLGDGTLRVTEISLKKGTVRVIYPGSIINVSGGGGDLTSSESDSWSAQFGRSFSDYGYVLSYSNEVVVVGCNVAAMVLAVGTGGENSVINPSGSIGGCASFCTKSYSAGYQFFLNTDSVTSARVVGCTGTAGCCKFRVTMPSPLSEVKAKRLGGNVESLPVNVFVAEEGWIDDQMMNGEVRPDKVKEVPVMLDWSVRTGMPSPFNYHRYCIGNARPMLCKSEHSSCVTNFYPGAGYLCRCDSGYDGNPYLEGGCQVLKPEVLRGEQCAKVGDVPSFCEQEEVSEHLGSFSFKSKTWIMIGLSITFTIYIKFKCNIRRERVE